MKFFYKSEIQKDVISSVWAACIHLQLNDYVATYLVDILWRVLSSKEVMWLTRSSVSDVLSLLMKAKGSTNPEQQYHLTIHAGEIALYQASVLLDPLHSQLPPVNPILCEYGQLAYQHAANIASDNREFRDDALIWREVSAVFPKCIDGLRLAQQDLVVPVF